MVHYIMTRLFSFIGKIEKGTTTRTIQIILIKANLTIDNSMTTHIYHAHLNAFNVLFDTIFWMRGSLTFVTYLPLICNSEEAKISETLEKFK